MQQQGATTSHCGVDHEDYQRLDPHACVVLLCCHGPAGSSGPHATKTETLPLIVTSRQWILSRSGKMLTNSPSSSTVPAEVARAANDILHKDLKDNLKRIEKLSK
jgi:hypothetical protein